jgi:phosphatidylinositol alpha-1,6-mannosyltransferase
VHRIALAAEQFGAGRGGIARVARLVAKTLALEAQAGHVEARGMSLNDSVVPEGLGLPIQLSGGSRLRFAARICATSPWATHFVFDFLGMARARCRVPGLRRPFLTFAHGIDIWEDARPDRLRVARAADTLLFDTEYARQRAIRTHGDFPRSEVCWLATEEDDPPIGPAYSPSGQPTVLIVGRLDETPWKGHHELIDAWPSVTSAIPDARLLIVGEGPGLGAAKARARAGSASGAIEFRGYVPESEIEAVWRSANVLAMPGVAEGFGLVYIEAMRYGLPVIASVHDAGQEVNVDGVTGFNVDLGQPGELADRLAALLGDAGRAARMGQRGFERWQQHFRFTAFRGRFLERLRSFVG